MIHRLCFIAMTAILSACVSVLPEQAAPDALYRIPPPAERIALSADVAIHEPDAPRIFAGRAIASEAPDGGLKLVPNIEWADRATRLLQVALIDAFDPAGAGKAVAAGGLSLPTQELDWRLVDFHMDGDGAVCRVLASFYDADARAIIARETITATAAMSGSGQAARVAAMRAAATDCIARTAAFVAKAQQEAESRDQAAAVWPLSGTGR